MLVDAYRVRLVEFSLCFECVCFSVWSWAGTVSTWWSEETTGSSRCGALTTWTSCTPTLPVIAVFAHWPCHMIRGEMQNNLQLCSDQAKANPKAKIVFDVCSLFVDLLHFRPRFRLVWIDSKDAFTLSEREHFLWFLSLLKITPGESDKDHKNIRQTSKKNFAFGFAVARSEYGLNIKLDSLWTHLGAISLQYNIKP